MCEGVEGWGGSVRVWRGGVKSVIVRGRVREFQV